jgi:short-subunit dehydrogenase
MRQLHGTTGLVTGASRGIGPFIARALAREGVNLVVTARTRPPLEQLAEELRSLGVTATAIAADLERQADRVALVTQAEQDVGTIDILINNAGIESEGAFVDLDTDAVNVTVATNLVAPMQLTRLVLPGMIRRGHGHVVNISSTGGKRGAPYDAVYCGTKAGLIQWSNAVRLEVRDTGVYVSTICPGYVTNVGMFARFGMEPPFLVGSCAPQQVAAACVRAIRRRRPEIIVNSRPLRPLLALGELFPRFADRALIVLGVPDFQRRKGGR